MDPLKAEFTRIVRVMGWSQSETARKLDITPQAVSQIMNPNHPNSPKVTLQLLKLIAMSEKPEAFNMARMEIKAEADAAGPELKDDYPSAEERELLTALRQADPDHREKIIAMVKLFLTRQPIPTNYLVKKKGRR